MGRARPVSHLKYMLIACLDFFTSELDSHTTDLKRTKLLRLKSDCLEALGNPSLAAIQKMKLEHIKKTDAAAATQEAIYAPSTIE